MGFDEKSNVEEQPMLPKNEAAFPPVPAPAGLAPSAQEEQEWSTGLFDCCVQPGGGALGCVSLCMPFVQYGVIMDHLHQQSQSQGGGFCGAAVAYAALDVLASLSHCLVWPGVSLLPTSALLHVHLRGHLRRKYNIKGSGAGDLCTAWWCGPCALAQETREIIVRAAAEQAAGQLTAPAAAPPALMGYMFIPVGGYTVGPNAGVTPLGPAPQPPVPVMMAANGLEPHGHAEAVPATGIPVNGPPPTQVATVTLQSGCAKAAPA